MSHISGLIVLVRNKHTVPGHIRALDTKTSSVLLNRLSDLIGHYKDHLARGFR